MTVVENEFEADGQASTLEIVVRTTDDDIHVELAGALDATTVQQCEPVLTAAALFHPRQLVVDLEGLRAIDAAGAALLEATGALLGRHHGRLLVGPARPEVEAALDGAGTWAILLP